MAITIKGNVDNAIYGKGDICLKLNPFDSYRMFTLYEDWRSDDRKPIDLSNGQQIFLVFKSKNKEIRIPEFSTLDGGYNVDKVNGQVLFKINQKNAIDILAMDSRTFYITRIYETTDMSGEKVIASDEEVLYVGQWKDENSNAVDDYTTQIKRLMSLLDERNKSISDLQASNAMLIEQNVKFAAEIESLKSENDVLTKSVVELETKVNEYESGVEYDGTVVGSATHTTIITNKQYTEDQLKEAVKNLETKSQS